MKRMIFLMLICAIALSVSGQDKENTKYLLESKSWYTIGNGSASFYLFKDVKMHVKYFNSDRRCYLNSLFPYYLSDTPDSVFVADKVGKSETGKYLISVWYHPTQEEAEARIGAILKGHSIDDKLNTPTEYTVPDIKRLGEERLSTRCYKVVTLDDNALVLIQQYAEGRFIDRKIPTLKLKAFNGVLNDLNDIKNIK